MAGLMTVSGKERMLRRGSRFLEALRMRFGKKQVHRRGVIHKSRSWQRDRQEVHQRFNIALRQMSYNETRQMLRELDAWLRAKIESAADFLLEAFEELRSSTG